MPNDKLSEEFNRILNQHFATYFPEFRMGGPQYRFWSEKSGKRTRMFGYTVNKVRGEGDRKGYQAFESWSGDKLAWSRLFARKKDAMDAAYVRLQEWRERHGKPQPHCAVCGKVSGREPTTFTMPEGSEKKYGEKCLSCQRKDKRKKKEQTPDEREASPSVRADDDPAV